MARVRVRVRARTPSVSHSSNPMFIVHIDRHLFFANSMVYLSRRRYRALMSCFSFAYCYVAASAMSTMPRQTDVCKPWYTQWNEEHGIKSRGPWLSLLRCINFIFWFDEVIYTSISFRWLLVLFLLNRNWTQCWSELWCVCTYQVLNLIQRLRVQRWKYKLSLLYSNYDRGGKVPYIQIRCP